MHQSTSASRSERVALPITVGEHSGDLLLDLGSVPVLPATAIVDGALGPLKLQVPAYARVRPRHVASPTTPLLARLCPAARKAWSARLSIRTQRPKRTPGSSPRFTNW